MHENFDAVVVGGGLVGAACALALSKLDLKVALVESRKADPEPLHQVLDSRIYAISPGNAAWLDSLGVWDGIDPERICPIDSMQVYGDDADAQLALDSYEANAGNLGYILENTRLQHALWQRLLAADITLLTGHDCREVTWRTDNAELVLDDGRTLTTQLLIAADGSHSWLRTQAEIQIKAHDYGQMGVVANFESELPHAQIARQWFLPDGVLAWLPLPGKHISMVWSTSDRHAHELLALDAATLADTVARAGNRALGALQLINVAQAFPLSLQVAHCLVKPRLALVGDAAHTIHPLAGQGVNLGFRDVHTLIEILSQRGSRHDTGDFMLLRRYERARKSDIMAVRGLTHGLHHLFASERRVVKQLRNWGLRFTNRQALVKKRLIKQAMF